MAELPTSILPGTEDNDVYTDDEHSIVPSTEDGQSQQNSDKEEQYLIYDPSVSSVQVDEQPSQQTIPISNLILL